MPEKKSLIPWIVLGVLILAGLAIYLVARTRTETEQPRQVSEPTPTTEPTTEENLTNIDPTAADFQIEENLNLATKMALKWRDDAALVFVQVKLSSLTLNEGMEIYVFDSPTLKDWHFTFTISQKTQKYVRAAIPTEDYLGSGLLPIDFKFWKLNYVSALQTAEQVGGKDFREKNLDWSIEVNLKREAPKNWLYFTVLYQSKEGEAFSVKINSSSGEVAKETETET